MKTRIITAVVALVAFVPVLFFSHTAVFPIVIGLLSAIAGYELCGAAGVGGRSAASVLTALYCFTAPVLARYAYILFVFTTALYLFAMLCLCVITFPKVSAKGLMAATAMGIFAAFAYFGIVFLRDKEPYDYLLLFVAAWCTDTFAIFGGKFFGKRKLAPNLSPKKTVEGLICGVLGAVVGFGAFCAILDFGMGVEVNWAAKLIIAVPAGLLAQLGDLVASAIKRDCGIKDYGKLFPGHGGVMDRFDSVMFLSVAATVGYFTLALTGVGIVSLFFKALR